MKDYKLTLWRKREYHLTYIPHLRLRVRGQLPPGGDHAVGCDSEDVRPAVHSARERDRRRGRPARPIEPGIDVAEERDRRATECGRRVRGPGIDGDEASRALEEGQKPRHRELT